MVADRGSANKEEIKDYDGPLYLVEVLYVMAYLRRARRGYYHGWAPSGTEIDDGRRPNLH